MYLVHTVLNGGAKQTGVTKTSKWILPCTLLCLFGTASASNEHAAPTLESAHVVFNALDIWCASVPVLQWQSLWSKFCFSLSDFFCGLVFLLLHLYAKNMSMPSCHSLRLLGNLLPAMHLYLWSEVGHVCLLRCVCASMLQCIAYDLAFLCQNINVLVRVMTCHDPMSVMCFSALCLALAGHVLSSLVSRQRSASRKYMILCRKVRTQRHRQCRMMMRRHSCITAVDLRRYATEIDRNQQYLQPSMPWLPTCVVELVGVLHKSP